MIDAYHSQLVTLSGGFAGLAQTVAQMRAYVTQARSDSNIRSVAIGATSMLAAKDELGEIQALLSWVQSNIRYLSDIYQVETLQTPVMTIELGVGDCDDQATLLAALLESIGYPTRFIVAGYSQASQYEHVYLQALAREHGLWIDLDPTEKNLAGWCPPGALCIGAEVV